jgi:hypothetical protein
VEGAVELSELEQPNNQIIAATDMSPPDVIMADLLRLLTFA